MNMTSVATRKMISLANQGYEYVSNDASAVTLSMAGKQVIVDRYGRVTWLKDKEDEA